MVKVTMADVAEKAGVSKSTVSQYLNKRYEYMSAETRSKIEEAIEELEYQPNALARSLKQKRTSTIGIIVANIMHSFSTEICRAIEDYFQEYGMNVMLCNSYEDAEKEKMYIEMLQAKQVDGIILFPTGKNKQLYKKLTKQRTPILFIDRKVEGINTDIIAVNNGEAVYKAIEHLAEQGHRKIAILTAPLTISSRMERMEGYKRAVKELGLEQHEPFMISCEMAEMKSRLNKLFAGEIKPSAIIAGNDLVLLEVLAHIKANAIKVPEQLALIVFDNISFAHLLQPTLTSIIQPSQEMGKAAGELLHERIKADGQIDASPRERIFECKLVVRESTLRSTPAEK
ncbi:LacI family DNA-binding transcriptional regulator [Paenibacillus beijingensis]|uniref:LacI family transcriptional regulator n=1 Tax=Paenibacillus beijingensis TaxID=1126833 RepID=A0A0D5NDZ4_9BACL|nr:substrate-binding domain-containing protein [Paenibacillus beijingensis]AJY73471.1 LacI family transcriptional regulator [Paenibacillus beijingensis]